MGEEEKLTVEYKDGDTIFSQEDPGGEMYIIRTGQVKITKKMDGFIIRVAVLKEGDFFGEMALFGKEIRSATATAQGRTVLTCLDTEAFRRQVREDPDFALRIIQKTGERLRKIDDEVTSLLTKGVLPIE